MGRIYMYIQIINAIQVVIFAFLIGHAPPEQGHRAYNFISPHSNPEFLRNASASGNGKLYGPRPALIETNQIRSLVGKGR